MSGSKKPTVSEIRAHYEGMAARNEAAFYLLDLVERAATEIDVLLQDDYTKHMRRDDVREARALLEELGQ